ncbi:MAG: SGNH/GDSL hydrolase family protein, partial [Acutalibacteraceae bacterium]
IVFYYRSIKIHDISGDIRVPESTEVPTQTALFYGSSITNGAAAEKTADTFAYRIAESLEMDYYNLGMSGSCMCEQEVANYIASLKELSFISLEMGANMQGLSVEEFKAKVKAFIQTVATAHSDIPVFCVDMIYNYDDKAGGGSDKKTTQMRVAVEEAVSELGLSNTVYVNGLTLMNSADGLSSDSVHPNQTGIDEVYSNYLPIIKNNIPTSYAMQSVLSSCKLSGRYCNTANEGIAFDGTANTLEFTADCKGNVSLEMTL